MRLRFGPFSLDPDRHELRRGERVLEVQPKVLALIAYLVENRGRLIGQEELFEAVWPGTAVSSASIARAISLARRILGDRATDARFIVTVARRGYRFVEPVEVEGQGQGQGQGKSQDQGEGEGPGDYVGRRFLIARAGAMLDDALAGQGRILFLSGEAGIGKSRTAELLVDRARKARAEVAAVWGLPSPSPSFWFWTCLLGQVVGSDPRALDALPRSQQVLLAGILTDQTNVRPMVPSGSGEAARLRLFQAVLALLTRAARRRPLVLVVDDLHAADAESIAMLESVGRGLASLRVAIITTCREEDSALSPQQAKALEQLLRVGVLERLSVSGLRADELVQFVERRLGQSAQPALIAALERQTDGNPLLLGEALRFLDDRALLGGSRDQAAWEALLPRGIERLLRAKLAQLSTDAIDLLACAAAIGFEFDREFLERCARIRSTVLDRILDECAASGLLQLGPGRARLRFAHGLVRDALYSSLVPTPESRRSLHARICRTYEHFGLSSTQALAEAARHGCLAIPEVAPRTASRLARKAAHASEKHLDFSSAASWYANAIDADRQVEDPDSSWRAELLLGLARCQTRSIGLEKARPAYHDAADAARAAQRLDLLALAALGFAQRPNSTGQGDPEVVTLLEDALAELPANEAALRIRIGSRLAAELRYSERDRMAILGAQALSEARALGDPLVLAQTLDDATFMQWSAADPEAWIALNAEVARWARAAGDVDLEVGGHKACVSGALEVGDLTRAQRAIRACGRVARATPIPYARWWCSVLDATTRLISGDLASAEASILESLRIAEHIESPEIAIELQGQFVYLRIEQGRSAEILDAAREQVRRFPHQPTWRAALARIAAALGEDKEARVTLAPLVDDGFASIPIDRAWVATHALAAEAVAALGDARPAETLLTCLRPFASRSVVLGSALYYGPVAHFLGLLSSALSDWDSAIASFETALAAEKRIGARLFAARTRVACARALFARDGAGDRARGSRLLREAREAAAGGGYAAVLAEAKALESEIWRRGRERDERKR